MARSARASASWSRFARSAAGSPHPYNLRGVSRPRSFHVWTIGCQMNAADSESLARQLLAAGYTEATDLDQADVAVLNTCVVRQASEDKVYSKLHELRRWKTPGRTLALTGCLVK